jgi:hypothetical protein
MLKFYETHENILNSMNEGWILHTSSGCFHSDVWLEKNGVKREDFDRKAASDIMKSDRVKEIRDPVRSTTVTSHFVLV